MTCAIKWNTLSIDEWEDRFSRIAFSNLLQSYDYARAAAPHARHKVRWGLIVIGGKEAGLVQMFEAGILWNAFHAVMIDRGPLWFEGFGGALHVKLFCDEINHQFPARFGRRRRFLPEIEDGPTAQKLIAGAGLTRLENQTGYQTFWIDLQQSEEDLEQALRPNWRGALGKARKSDLGVTWEYEPNDLAWAAALHGTEKKLRGFRGIDPVVLVKLAAFSSPKDGFLFGRALNAQGEAAAFTIMARHGRSATYLAGWSGQEGRDKAAHHLLLWQSLLSLKAKGVCELDLGGVNEDEKSAGLKSFKEGLGGRFVRYVGFYT